MVNAGCTIAGADKILISRALVISLNVRYFKVANGSKPVKYIGETEKKLRDLFANAGKEPKEIGEGLYVAFSSGIAVHYREENKLF